MWSQLILVACLCIITYTSVAGIDYGSQLIKGSFIRPGSQFTIIENQQSKRKTESILTFDKDRRFFGPDALQKQSKLPLQTLPWMFRLLGETYNSTTRIQEFQDQGFQYQFSKNERGTIDVKVNNDLYSIEEVNAMILEYFNKLLKTQTNEQIMDCVISVPVGYNYFQRKTLNDALRLASWNPLAFVTENTAAALFFGRDVQTETTKNIMFFNMGSINTEVSIFQFATYKKFASKPGPSVKVLGEAIDQDLGARDLDVIIENLLTKEAQDLNPQVPITRKNRLRIKLSSEKIKKQLSANIEVLVRELEIHDYKNLQVNMQRSDVEDEIKDKWEIRIQKLIQDALLDANVTLDDIAEIEMIGGGVRIPLVQTIVQQQTGKTLGWHVNGDEDMSNGNALMAANFSSTMQLRNPVQIYIPVKHYTSRLYDNEGLDKNTILNKFQGAKKDISVTHAKQLYVDILEDGVPVTRYLILGADKALIKGQENYFNDSKYSNTQMTTKLFLTYKFSQLGWVELENARAQRNISYRVLEKVTNATTNQTTEMVKDKNNLDKYELRIKPQTIEGQMPILLNTSEFQISQKKLEKLSQRDDEWYIVKEKKNKLESSIYAIRSDLEDKKMDNYAKEEQQQELKLKTEELEEWLYEEGLSANLSRIEEKARELQALAQPIYSRSFESANRDSIIKWATSKVADLSNLLATLPIQKPWITQAQTALGYNKLNDTNTWIDEVIKEQAKRTNYEEPVFFVAQIEEKIQKLEETVQRIQRTPKPKETKKSDSGDGANKPIKIGNQSFTMEEFEEWQKYQNTKIPTEDLPKTDEQQSTEEQQEEVQKETEEEGAETQEEGQKSEEQEAGETSQKESEEAEELKQDL